MPRDSRFGPRCWLCGPAGPANERADGYDDDQSQDQTDERRAGFGEAGGDQKRSCSRGCIGGASDFEDGDHHCRRSRARGSLVKLGAPVALTEA